MLTDRQKLRVTLLCLMAAMLITAWLLFGEALGRS